MAIDLDVLVGDQDQAYLDMIDLLRKQLSKFQRPQLAPLGWTKPKSVDVNGMMVTEKELRDLLTSYESGLSEKVFNAYAKKFDVSPKRVFNTTAVINKISDVASRAFGGDGKFVPPPNEPLTQFAGRQAPTTADIAQEKKLKDRLDYLNGLEPDAQGKFLVDGKLMLPSKFYDLLDKTNSEYEKVSGSATRASAISQEEKTRLEQALSSARANLNQLLERAKNPGIGGRPTDEAIATASKAVKDLETQLSIVPTTTVTETTETPTPKKFGVPTGVRRQEPSETPPPDDGRPTPTKPTPTPSPGAPSQEEWVNNQLDLRNLPDTPKNRKEIAAEYKKTKFKPLGDNWIELFNAKFPTLGFIFTNPEFGPEVIEIARKAIEQQWYLYPETAQGLIAREIANTPYGQRSSAKQEAFDKKNREDQQVDIAQKVGELQGLYGKLDLSESEWQQIGYTAARNGLDDTLTRQKMLEFVYQKNPEGTYRYDTAVQQLEAGRLGQEVRKAYGNYFITPDEEAIKDYATGKRTLEDINRQARELAKQFYPALASMLDQGLTVKSVADQYASIAAQTLEVPANTIDMMDAKFRTAFDVREGDKSRTMTSGEFQTLLKTDPKYGWQYTKTANQEAMDLATTIARAFGKVE